MSRAHSLFPRLFGVDPRLSSPPWAEFERLLRLIIQHQEAILASLDDILKDVTAESTRLDSLSTLFGGLKQQLADALSGTTLPPATQAKIDQIFAAAEANSAKIDTALNTGVPAPAPSPTTTTAAS